MTTILDSENEPRVIITVYDELTERFIKAPTVETTWPEVMTTFVQVLNGMGYIIDPIKADKAINDLALENSKDG
jgi:hypothetical protein